MIFDDHKIEKLLKSISRTEVPAFDFMRVRNHVLRRITVAEKSETGVYAKVFSFVPYLRIGAGVMASLLIVVSLTLGTAVAALQSVPGSTIYPLKKVVENIQLRLTPEAGKPELQIKFANTRIEELRQVLDQKQEGKISDQEAQTIIANTVKDLQKTTSAAVTGSKSQSKSTAIADKLADISNKLRAASVKTEGQVRIEIEKALEDTKISQEEAIKNLEQAGMKLEDAPIKIDEIITASGKITDAGIDYISIGTAKFLLTNDTKFQGMEDKDLKAGIIVDIKGQIKDNKSYALEIIKISETKTETTTESQQPPTTEEPQNAQ